MGKAGKVTTLLLVVVLATSSLMVIKSASGTSNLSAPEFTLEYVDKSYYVPVTYGIDPYSGKNITTGGGFTIDNKTLVFTIKNQPFTPYTDSEGNQINLFYQVNVKGHYEDDWSNLFEYINASDTEYTTRTYIMGRGSINQILIEVQNGDQLDFQLETQIGYYTRDYINFHQYYNVFTGETSGRSEIQTLTIGESKPVISNPSAAQYTPTATQTDTVEQASLDKVLFGLEWKDLAIGLMGAIITVLVLMLVFRKGRTKTDIK